VAYSRDWDPRPNLITFRPVRTFWKQCCGYVPAPDRETLRASVPFPVCKSLSRHGQWIDIYVNPAPVLRTAVR
jgi:hypothetical protein